MKKYLLSFTATLLLVGCGYSNVPRTEKSVENMQRQIDTFDMQNLEYQEIIERTGG